MVHVIIKRIIVLVVRIENSVRGTEKEVVCWKEFLELFLLVLSWKQRIFNLYSKLGFPKLPHLPYSNLSCN